MPRRTSSRRGETSPPHGVSDVSWLSTFVVFVVVVVVHGTARAFSFTIPARPAVPRRDSPSSSSSSSSSSSFDEFDYRDQWYPVVWARELVAREPTKVTVFDEDYVVARLDDDVVVAMEDRCPHKSAALSEGRITAGGRFQCAYHGWSFDGETGACVEIPQTTSTTFGARTCGVAVPATVSQGMVWLFPFGDRTRAAAAPPPPTVPEMDDDDFKVMRVTRDFPVDWSLLLENIMDADHGLFAHNVQGKGFDKYTASPEKEGGVGGGGGVGCPMEVVEEWANGTWTIESRVLSKEVLLASTRSPVFRAKERKRRKRNKGKQVEDEASSDDSSDLPYATTTFVAPHHVVIGRRDQKTNDTKFLSCFWVCPVGTGRSRFMSAAVARGLPFKPPDWILQASLNNFLDQDTYLLATQQTRVLSAEADAVARNGAERGDPRLPTDVRRRLYVYRSPSERANARVGAFLDATLSRAPRRVGTLRDAASWRWTPPREVVLDRGAQTRDVSPTARDLVRRCRATRTIARATAAAAAAAAVTLRTGATTPRRWTWTTATAAATAVLAWATARVAGTIERQFFFKADRSYHRRDVEKIVQVWADDDHDHHQR